MSALVTKSIRVSDFLSRAVGMINWRLIETIRDIKKLMQQLLDDWKRTNTWVSGISEK